MNKRTEYILWGCALLARLWITFLPVNVGGVLLDYCSNWKGPSICTPERLEQEAIDRNMDYCIIVNPGPNQGGMICKDFFPLGRN